MTIRLSPSAARAFFVLGVPAISKPSEGAQKRAVDTSAKYVLFIIKGVAGDAAGPIMIAEMLMSEALSRLHANAERREELLAHFAMFVQRLPDDPEFSLDSRRQHGVREASRSSRRHQN